MPIISEKNVDTISKQLGEPSVFCDWRKEISHTISKIAPDLSYGLSISVDQKVFQNADFKDVGVKYEHEGDLDVHFWPDVIANTDLFEKVFQIFQWSISLLSKDYFRGYFASVFKEARVVHTKKGQRGSIRLSTVCTKNTSDFVCIIAEDDVHIVVIDDVHVEDAMLARTVLIQTNPNAKVEYVYSRSGKGSLHTTILSNTASQGILDVVTLSRAVYGNSKSHTESYLTGEGAQVRTAHVSVATEGVSDIQDIAVHDASHTDSTLGASGVATKKGTLVYRSDIVMKTEGTGSLAGAQKARFLVMSQDAEVDAIPSLDIAQKDVSCSHSVSVSHLKDDDTFYPRLRGVDREFAAAMIVEGLLVEPVLHMKDHTHIFEYIENALKEDISNYE